MKKIFLAIALASSFALAACEERPTEVTPAPVEAEQVDLEEDGTLNADEERPSPEGNDNTQPV